MEKRKNAELSRQGILMRSVGLFLIAAVAIMIADPAFAQANLHDASGTYDGLLDIIRNTANQWSDRLQGYATKLFWSLAIISAVWRFGQLALKQAEFGEIAGELARFLMITGVFYTLVLYSVDIASAIVNSFRQAGASAAGVGMGLRPGDLFGLGVELAKTVGSFDTLNLQVAVIGGFAAVIILLCFAFIAAFMAITMIEAYVVINASVLLMGFGGSEWTREYAMAMLRASVAIGVKLFVLTLIVGIIMTSARVWQVSYRQDDTSTLVLLGMALVCAAMVKTVTDFMSSLISGISPGGGSVLGGMAAAGMAGAAAGMAVLQSSGMLSGAGGAFKSVSDSIKGSGSSVPPGGGSGSGGASFMNSKAGGNSTSGYYSGPGARVGGGSHSVPPAPSAPSGTSSASSTMSSTNTPKTGGMSAGTAAHMAADTAVRTVGIATSIAVPGAEGMHSLSVGPPPTPLDLSGLSDSIGETPENVIRPASDISMPETAPPPIDTMESLQDALNNRGKMV